MQKPISLIFTVLFSLFCTAGYAQSAKKPNIIIILADDLGWGDVGYHGSDIRTPNIDGLAKEGLILNRYYTAPICSPTRVGLLTGRYPNRVGIRQATIPPWSDFGLDTSEVLLPQMLARAGYQNRAIIGKWHLGHATLQYHPMNRGFTHFYGHLNGAIDYFSHKREGEPDWQNDFGTSKDQGYSTDLLTAEAVKCIGSYAKQSPFFMYVAFNAPHGPFQAKDEDLKLYGFDPAKPRYASQGGGGDEGAEEAGNTVGHGNTIHQTYKAMVTCLDRGIGEILQAIKKAGIEDNTIVMFMSDNGAPGGQAGSNGELRGVKFNEWEGGVRVPAIIKWPKMIKGARQSEQLIGYVDVMPTLLDIAGIKSAPKKPFDGISMLPVLTAKTAEIKRELYLGHGALINNQWKLIKAHSGNPGMRLKEDMLFKIPADYSETSDQKAANATVYEQLLKAVAPYDSIRAKRELLGKGPKNGFKAPKDWLIKK